MRMESLFPRLTRGGKLDQTGPLAWHMEIPAGPAGRYRWAQLDDYVHSSRPEFANQQPMTLALRARVSARDLPGTWGFGLWNDPFSAGLGIGGTARRLPTLPNAAWFFHASPPNYLAFRDDHPAQGFLAATFSSAPVHPWVLAPMLPGLLLLLWRPTARWVRRMATRVIEEDSARLDLDVTTWHDYRLDWGSKTCRFWVDGRLCLETPVSPRGRLGLVIWIDNQYAALDPDGSLKYGTLETSGETWLEVDLS